MNRLPPIAFVLLVAAASMPGADGGQVTLPDRESTYPPQIHNITHEPWAPRVGEDVAVTIRLNDNATPPDNMTLLFCRVEPSYVCGLPFFLTPDQGRHEWQGTIAWDNDFMEPDTQHIGYNITLRFDDAERRIHAPIGNHWIPSTYPAESDGTYYFYRIDGAAQQNAPGPAFAVGVLLLAALAASTRRNGHDR